MSGVLTTATGCRCGGCGQRILLRAVHLARYDQDGRVELYHVTRRQRCGPVVLAGTAAPSSPPRIPPLPVARCSFRRRITEYERALILWALERSEGCIADAARLLGLPRVTLTQMIRRKGGRKAVVFEFAESRGMRVA